MPKGIRSWFMWGQKRSDWVITGDINKLVNKLPVGAISYFLGQFLILKGVFCHWNTRIGLEERGLGRFYCKVDWVYCSIMTFGATPY